MTDCRVCGADTYVDFRTRTLRCRDCDRAAVTCACAPVPVWIRRSRERRYGLARDLTGSAA